MPILWAHAEEGSSGRSPIGPQQQALWAASWSTANLLFHSCSWIHFDAHYCFAVCWELSVTLLPTAASCCILFLLSFSYPCVWCHRWSLKILYCRPIFISTSMTIANKQRLWKHPRSAMTNFLIKYALCLTPSPVVLVDWTLLESHQGGSWVASNLNSQLSVTCYSW